MLSTILLEITQTGAAVADTIAKASAPQKFDTLNIWDLTLKGGWIMIPIGIMSIIAVYIFVERYMTLKKAGKDDPNFMNNIRDFIHNGRLDSAVALCKSTQTPLARMIEKGLTRLGKPLNDINTAIENVGKLEVSRLEKNIAALATIAGAAPMLGFLGTVTGMVKAFYNMAKAGNNIDIQLLSSGIYEAMVTTVGGLIVGILAYICYNVLVARVEKVVFTLEARTTDFMDLLNEPID
jgi:biopolymer transport protein ExbB